jgi:hypothetical protein
LQLAERQLKKVLSSAVPDGCALLQLLTHVVSLVAQPFRQVSIAVQSVLCAQALSSAQQN